MYPHKWIRVLQTKNTMEMFFGYGCLLYLVNLTLKHNGNCTVLYEYAVLVSLCCGYCYATNLAGNQNGLIVYCSLSKSHYNEIQWLKKNILKET